MEAAPISRRSVGQRIEQVLGYYRKRGGSFEALWYPEQLYENQREQQTDSRTNKADMT